MVFQPRKPSVLYVEQVCIMHRTQLRGPRVNSVWPQPNGRVKSLLVRIVQRVCTKVQTQLLPRRVFPVLQVDLQQVHPVHCVQPVQPANINLKIFLIPTIVNIVLQAQNLYQCLNFVSHVPMEHTNLKTINKVRHVNFVSRALIMLAQLTRVPRVHLEKLNLLSTSLLQNVIFASKGNILTHGRLIVKRAVQVRSNYRTILCLLHAVHVYRVSLP